MTISPSTDLRVGTLVHFTCQTDTSNPAVDIRWQSPQGSVTQYTEEGKYHGVTTTSVLSITLQHRDFGQSVTCGIYWDGKEINSDLKKTFWIPSESLCTIYSWNIHFPIDFIVCILLEIFYMYGMYSLIYFIYSIILSRSSHYKCSSMAEVCIRGRNHYCNMHIIWDRII